jgi:predicted lipid-binding transport protein (Tim44 family)
MLTGRIFLAVLAMFAALMVVVEDVEARRMGGGRSVGRQYDRSSQREATPPQKNPQQGAQQTAPRNRFGGMLGGLAAGLGIAWLLSHFGLSGAFAEALGSMLVLGGLVFLLLFLGRRFGLFGSPRGASPAYAGGMTGAGAATSRFEAAVPGSAEHRGRHAPAPGWQAAAGDDKAQALSVTGEPLPGLGGSIPPSTTPLASADMRGEIPEDFNVESFVRAATQQYVQLQAAWDAGDLASLRDFTTPELFAELQSDIAARGGKPNHTEVLSVSAEVLAVRDVGSAVMASLRYFGTIREDGAEAAAFEEVWHLVRGKRGRDGWLLAGIEQTATPDGTESWGRGQTTH